MKHVIKVLTTPSCWIRCYQTNMELDVAIRKLIDEEASVAKVSSCTTKLGPLVLWTSNFPYAYGSIHDNDDIGLPSRATVFKLQKYLAKNKLTEYLNAAQKNA